MDNNISNKKYGLSYLRAISCMLVVLLHTAYSCVLIYGEGGSELNLFFSYSAVYLCMLAVPCFVMVTGALLLPACKNITYKKLFGKYILRVFSALLVFSLIFRAFDIVMDGEAFTFSAFCLGFKEFYTADGWSHLWYLYLIIGLYLLLPFYRMIAEKADGRDLKYLLTVYFIFLSVLPLIGEFTEGTGFYIHTSTIYPFYLFLGFALSENKIEIKKSVSIILLVISCVITVILSAVYVKNGSELTQAFFKYSSPTVIIGSAGLFGLLKDKKRAVRAADKILCEIDGCSFGIYIIHMLFVRLVLRYWQVNPCNYGGAAGIVLFSALFLVISYALVKCFKLLLGVKKKFNN